VRIIHPFVGNLDLIAGNGPDGAVPSPLFCENETNVARLFGAAPLTPYPKDGINDHVLSGAATVNPDLTGARWLDGDPGQPPPPPQRQNGRNARWRGFDAFDIMSMPDEWEYPWFAAWDLAFHAVALAHVDPAFAKYQLILLCR
jgi:hypothetical protein